MRYWKRTDTIGNTTTVESYSHDMEIEGAIEINRIEYEDFIMSLPVIKPEPVRDLAKEIDSILGQYSQLKGQYNQLKARINALEL